jgi:hypothetical protein
MYSQISNLRKRKEREERNNEKDCDEFRREGLRIGFGKIFSHRLLFHSRAGMFALID